MNPESKEIVAKALEQNELPSSKVTQVAGPRDTTPMEASGTCRVVKLGIPSGSGASGAVLGSGSGASK